MEAENPNKGSAFSRATERIVALLGEIGGYVAVAIMLLIVANIVLRLFWRPILGTYELVELWAVIFSSFALSYTALKRGHIVVSVITDLLPYRMRMVCHIIVSVFNVALLVFMAWVGGRFAARQWGKAEESDVLYIPVAPFRFVLVVSLVFFSLLLIIDLVRSFKEVTKK